MKTKVLLRFLRIKFRIKTFDPIVKPILENRSAHLLHQADVIAQIVDRLSRAESISPDTKRCRR